MINSDNNIVAIKTVHCFNFFMIIIWLNADKTLTLIIYHFLITDFEYVYFIGALDL